jgi:hypothetical protein
MHNCRLTRNGLIDLALDEMPSAEAKQLLAELNDCAACREEYATLRNTWRVSGQTLRSVLPTEGFWPGYHARLQAKLIHHLQEDNEKASSSLQPAQQLLDSPLWLRTWIAAWKLAKTSVRVPVPVALALMFLFVLSVFALRAGGTLVPREPVNATPSNQLASEETRMVQIPVIQERVVTRVVYVEKKGSRSRGSSKRLDREGLTAANRLARVGSDASGKTIMSLAGFKPTDQIKLTVIKGSYQDEK